MDTSTDSPADGQWMTLKELAAVRRISVASAARLMRRRHWRRQPGNDGHIRIWVPAGDQEPKVEVRPDDRADHRPDVLADLRSGVMEVIRPLQDAIAMLETQLTEANARAARADEAVAAERVRADVLRERIEALQTELRAAQDAADVLRQAEADRRGQGRWARLRAAWRRE